MNWVTEFEKHKEKIVSKLDIQKERIEEAIRQKNVTTFNATRYTLGKLIGVYKVKEINRLLSEQFVEQLIPIKGVEIKDIIEGEENRFELHLDDAHIGYADIRLGSLVPEALHAEEKKLDNTEFIIKKCEKDLKKYKYKLKETNVRLLLAEDDEEKKVLEARMLKFEQKINRYERRLVESEETLKNRHHHRAQLNNKQKRLKAFANTYHFNIREDLSHLTL
ncbi:hypothetical protein [Rossellomorea marisflavi]|uniref:hypothetical protein n=1 Tax=Rossellomorea marisflavi TaxID=189381 RepID=UPI003F9EE5E4